MTQFALLTDCAIASHFKTKQMIFREGEMANRFYLVESGKVVLESIGGLGDPVLVDTIGAGDLLGWSWMFPPYVWHFTARATNRPTRSSSTGLFCGNIANGSFVRLRAFQADQRRDGETFAGCAGTKCCLSIAHNAGR